LGDLTSAFQIYNTYQKRMKARYVFINAQLDKPTDFTIDET
jgi:hypothetical protein